MHRQLISRRAFVAQTFGSLAAAGTAFQTGAESPDGAIIQHGKIRQSVMGWCFKPMPVMELAQHCRAIGLAAMEGIAPSFYSKIMELGLKISLVGSHGFAQGPVSTANHEHCRKILRERIDLAARIGVENVITFTGMSEPGISPEQGAKNCVAFWKSLMRYAESKKVRLCLEHLNSRDDSHPMKGHPGYFGDDVDFCVDLIKRVHSPSMKLLFDVYHVQVMHGDVIRRIWQYQDFIAHYHTAGNPGRGELDENQEIHYPAVMRAILKTGYTGYVAHEFIPTWENKMEALKHAAAVCDAIVKKII